MSAGAEALTYSDLLRPVSRWNALLYDSVLVLGGSILIALAAKISTYLPFSPVPITGSIFCSKATRIAAKPAIADPNTKL